MAKTSDTGINGDLGRRLAHRALMPIVATAASAAAGYVAKKGPDLFEDKVLPKLKQAVSGASSVADDTPSRAKSVADDIGDLSGDLTDRVKDVTPGVAAGQRHRRNGELSQAELDRHVKRRAAARAARRKATSTK
jgi:hypothetical protein